jgi:hypothetical protein
MSLSSKDRCPNIPCVAQSVYFDIFQRTGSRQLIVTPNASLRLHELHKVTGVISSGFKMGRSESQLLSVNEVLLISKRLIIIVFLLSQNSK